MATGASQWFLVLAHGALLCVLGWTLQWTRGGLSQPALQWIVLAWVGAVAVSYALCTVRLSVAGPPPLVATFLALLVAWTSFALATKPGLIHAEDAAARRWLDAAVRPLPWLALGLAVAAAWPASSGARARERAFAVLAAGFLVCVFAARALTLIASPNPVIDVFTISTDGADHLLHGRNPYSQEYRDLYHGVYAYPPRFYYWPGIVLLEALSLALCGDVRWGFVVADAITAVLLVRLGQRLLVPWRVGLLVAMGWLAFPVALFVLEQAWIDTWSVTFTVAIAHCLVARRWRAAGLLLGYLLAIKQYNVLLGVLTLALAASQGRVAFVRLLTWSAVVFLGLVVPFVVWDGKSFVLYTIKVLLEVPVRPEALSIPAALIERRMPPIPDSVVFALIALAQALATWFAWRGGKRGPEPLRPWVAGLVLVYGLTFLLGKQAFCNYWYLLSSFVLLALLISLAQKPAADVAAAPAGLEIPGPIPGQGA